MSRSRTNQTRAPRYAIPLAVLLAGCGSCLSSPRDLGFLFDRSAFLVSPSPSTFRLGSGVIMGNGYILTVAHVLGHSEFVVVITTGRPNRARVVLRDRSADLALLKLEVAVPGLGGVRLARRARAPGTQVRLVSAAVAGIETRVPWTAAGEIASDVLRCPGDPRAECQLVDMTAGPGSSGAGVFDWDGRLVGILIGMHRVMRLSLVVTPETIRAFVSGLILAPAE
jgi:S1-C subfamily serine protease